MLDYVSEFFRAKIITLFCDNNTGFSKYYLSILLGGRDEGGRVWDKNMPPTLLFSVNVAKLLYV